MESSLYTEETTHGGESVQRRVHLESDTRHEGAYAEGKTMRKGGYT